MNVKFEILDAVVEKFFEDVITKENRRNIMVDFRLRRNKNFNFTRLSVFRSFHNLFRSKVVLMNLRKNVDRKKTMDWFYT